MRRIAHFLGDSFALFRAGVERPHAHDINRSVQNALWP